MLESHGFFLGRFLELLAINHSSLERRVVEAPPCSGYFTTCMGVRFPLVGFDNEIQFNTLSMVSGFLWHS